MNYVLLVTLFAAACSLEVNFAMSIVPQNGSPSLAQVIYLDIMGLAFWVISLNLPGLASRSLGVSEYRRWLASSATSRGLPLRWVNSVADRHKLAEAFVKQVKSCTCFCQASPLVVAGCGCSHHWRHGVDQAVLL